jgi:predicted CopG family antitoxin
MARNPWLNRFDLLSSFMHNSCMSKTITLDDDAYQLLRSLKLGARDSFTRVVLRHVHKPAETCGELLDASVQDTPPAVDGALLERLARERKRPSGQRK